MTNARRILDLPSLFGPTSVVRLAIGIFRAAVMLRKFSTVTDTSFNALLPCKGAHDRVGPLLTGTLYRM